MEFVIKAVVKGVGKKCDFYHAHDLQTVLPALISAIINNSKVLYDSHELYTETGNMSGFTKRLSEIMERFLIGKVDRVIAANRSRALIMQKKYENIPMPDVILNCSPSLECGNSKISSNKLPDFLAARGLKNKKIVLYQGGLMADRGLEELVLSAKSFTDDIVLILIGEGNLKEILKNIVVTQGLEKKVFFHEYVPYKELPVYSASAHLGVVIYKNTCLNNYYCAPNKLFEYAAVGLPVAACDFPEPQAIVNRYKIGKLFDPEDVLSIAAAINGIFVSPNGYNEMKENAFSVGLDFNWENEEKKLMKIYEDLSKGAV
jgi:glycosyltransferase involved in cell wall biosynthesis